jgi:hypothetical protein
MLQVQQTLQEANQRLLREGTGSLVKTYVAVCLV